MCKTLERLYGLKCTAVPEKCNYQGDYLSYEIYYLNVISRNLRGDVVDDSPLTPALYIKEIWRVKGQSETFEELYNEILEGIEDFVKDLKAEGHVIIWLTARADVLEKRIMNSDCVKRKLVHENLLNLGYIMAEERNLLQAKWKNLVDAVVDTSDKSPEEVAKEVMEVARSKGCCGGQGEPH